MSQYIELNPYSPHQQVLTDLVKDIQNGKVIAYPTDSGYALGCKMGLKKPIKKIQEIRQLDNSHNFTIICRDLSEISVYAKVDNPTYRALKRCTPGSYTFILSATSKVPDLMLNKKKKTIGIRVPDHPVPRLLADALGEPLLSTTLILPEQEAPLIYPEDVDSNLSDQVDIIVDAGYCGYDPTTVVDFTTFPPQVLRYGSGDHQLFE
ncbi:L-threonylcarbamoyladenylate synthase [Francisellaceae bacterium]|nr:L-threonylcarbamoyladenylate synthase [Francisellaceae bacterium]